MRNTMFRRWRVRTGLSATALTIFTSYTLALTLSALLALPAVGAEYEGAYSYLRVVDGDATLFQGDTGEREAAATNLPLLTGDRVWVAPGARLEVILSDGNILRLDGDTEVRFERLAYSPEAEHPYTELALTEGNLQLVVVDEFLGEERPRLTTPNATIYLHKAGSYRLTADRQGFTQLVVRAGYAEVVSQRGSTIARSGEEVVVEGTEWPRSAVYRAADLDALELWGEELERAAAEAPEYVDEDLRYAAADLDDYGTWVTVDHRTAWRPLHYEDDWRPYRHGRWRHTPTGLVWVSYEPWGWVPYHYGSWDHHPVYGWVWYPGSRFAPAHVYWYWGSGYVAWYPRGYYDHYYSHHYYGHSDYLFALYGYGGGSWRYFDDWIFCRTDYLGSRRQYRYVEYGHDVRRHTGWDEVPRGVVTTDTGPLGRLDRDEWRNSRRVQEVLEAIPTGDGRGLRDVTPILERRPELNSELRQVLNDGRLRARPEGLKPTTVRRPTDVTTATPGGSGTRGSSGTTLRRPGGTSGGGTVGTPRSPVESTVRRPGTATGGTTASPRSPTAGSAGGADTTTVRRPGTTSSRTPRTPSTGTVERGTVRDRSKPTTGTGEGGGRDTSGVAPRSPASPRSPNATRGGGSTGTRNPSATEAPRTRRPSSGTTVRPGSGSSSNRGGSTVNRGGSTTRRDTTSTRRDTTSTRRPSASSGSSSGSSSSRGGTVQRGSSNRRSPSASSGGNSSTTRRPSSASRSPRSGSSSKPSSTSRSTPRSSSKPSSAGSSGGGSSSRSSSTSRSTPRSGSKPSSASRSDGGSGNRSSSASRSRSSSSKPNSSNSGGGRRGAKPRNQNGGDGR